MVKLVYDFRVRSMLIYAMRARDGIQQFLARNPYDPDTLFLSAALADQNGLIDKMLDAFVSDATVEPIAPDSVPVPFTAAQVADLEAA